jgi:hypothetical protein
LTNNSGGRHVRLELSLPERAVETAADAPAGALLRSARDGAECEGAAAVVEHVRSTGNGHFSRGCTVSVHTLADWCGRSPATPSWRGIPAPPALAVRVTRDDARAFAHARPAAV